METFDAVAGRHSTSKVTTEAPGHDEVVRLVSAAGRAADHSSLQPWRVIEVRGGARERLGQALADAAGHHDPSRKPLRASLLLAVVVSRRESRKVPAWEQEATAAGVAHYLSLLLTDAGWGVMWRTGELVRTEPVRRMHGLADGEDLLGWLYVGGVPDDAKRPRDRAVDAETFVTVLDG